MMARLDDSQIKIKVQDVLVRCGVAEEDTGKVVGIKFAPACARPFNADTSAKHLQMRDVGLEATPSLVRGLVEGRVDKPIVEIDRMHQSRRPKFCRKPGSIKQCTNNDGEGIVVYFRTTILRGAVSTSWLNHIAKLLEHHIPKCTAPC
jgi:hypothetical protein